MTDASPYGAKSTPPFSVAHGNDHRGFLTTELHRAVLGAILACVLALVCFWVGTSYGKRSGRIALEEDSQEAAEAQ